MSIESDVDAGELMGLLDNPDVTGAPAPSPSRGAERDWNEEWVHMEDLVRGGERVLDLGTGTGILPMAAVRLGAASRMGPCCSQGYSPRMQRKFLVP